MWEDRSSAVQVMNLQELTTNCQCWACFKYSRDGVSVLDEARDCESAHMSLVTMVGPRWAVRIVEKLRSDVIRYAWIANQIQARGSDENDQRHFLPVADAFV